jgi:polyisoprenyl-teichoic acid--peptidoglycan teichoic acid transferase
MVRKTGAFECVPAARKDYQKHTCCTVIGALDFLRMREFQEYTKTHRAARRQLWLWSLPVGLVATLMLGLGMQVGAVPAPMELVGYGTGRGWEAYGGDAPGWSEGIFGRSPEVSDVPLTVLVLGLDRRPPGSREPQVAGTRSDMMMLVRVVPGTGEIKLLSIPRDLLVEVEPGVEDRINAAYSHGGVEQAGEVVEGLTGIPIDRYAIVDFEGFSDVVDAMGGVEVDVEDEIPPKHGIEDGLQILNGEQALFYTRWRGTPGGDLDRIEHQQQLVAALRSKALNWDTVTKLPEIMEVMDENVETNLGYQEALSLGRVLISRGRNAQMTSVQLKGTPGTLPGGTQVLVPNDAANEATLEEFRY